MRHVHFLFLCRQASLIWIIAIPAPEVEVAVFMDQFEPPLTPHQLMAMVRTQADQLAMLVALVEQLTERVHQQGVELSSLIAKLEALRVPSVRH
jgi:hypothetical protein